MRSCGGLGIDRCCRRVSLHILLIFDLTPPQAGRIDLSPPAERAATRGVGWRARLRHVIASVSMTWSRPGDSAGSVLTCRAGLASPARCRSLIAGRRRADRVRTYTIAQITPKNQFRATLRPCHRPHDIHADRSGQVWSCLVRFGFPMEVDDPARDY